MAQAPKQAKTATDVKLEAYTKGMQSNYSHYFASPNSWSHLENVDTDKQGILQTRPNIFIAGTLPGAALGAGIFERGLTTRFLIKSGSTLYNLQSNALGTGAISSTLIILLHHFFFWCVESEVVFCYEISSTRNTSKF